MAADVDELGLRFSIQLFTEQDEWLRQQMIDNPSVSKSDVVRSAVALAMGKELFEVKRSVRPGGASKYRPCDRCGVVMANARIHARWHMETDL